jgi:hypothetical protein
LTDCRVARLRRRSAAFIRDFLAIVGNPETPC